MKIKLNLKQIQILRREIRENSRKDFDIEDLAEVFKMLKFWTKSFGTGEEKIKSIAALPDGYLCRVNEKFHDSMKSFIKEAKARRYAEEISQRTAEEYDRLIKEAEEQKERTEHKRTVP
jgi:hypothetical protein